jgi:Glycosyl transferases group 1
MNAARMRVHVLSARTTKAFNSMYPLRAFRRGIRQRGVTVRIYDRPDPSVTDCDVLCVTSEHWKLQRKSGTAGSILDFVGRYRDAVATLIWLDTTDSSGTTSFEVLPFVDLYAKSQLLRDRSRYTEPFYGLRCYTDFYHKNYRITDATETFRVAAHPSHLDKLAVSWNLGLGSYVQENRDFATRFGRLRFYWPFAAYTWTRTAPNGRDRNVDVSFRGLLDYGSETLSFQRQETYRRLAEFARQRGCTAAYCGRLPYRQYREEMRQSKLVLSPFGFGEINAGRDFECFADGAALVKPDVSHLVTWPDYFEAGVTYAAHDWSFSDFESTLETLLVNPEERVRIAHAGQTRYLRSLSFEGEAAFAGHFHALLERAGGTYRN